MNTSNPLTRWIAVAGALTLGALASPAQADDYAYTASGRTALENFLGGVPRGNNSRLLANSTFPRAQGVLDRACAQEARDIEDAASDLDSARTQIGSADGAARRLTAAHSALRRCRSSARADMGAVLSRAVLALFEDRYIDAWNYSRGRRPDPDPVAAFCGAEALTDNAGACRGWFHARVSAIAARQNPDGVWEGPGAGPGAGMVLLGPQGEVNGVPTGLVWTIINAFGRLEAMPGAPAGRGGPVGR
jgi:hypothetical protein